MIRIEELCASYGRERVLGSVSVTFPKGKLSVVIGPNGCGKTTLLKSIMGLVPIESGDILINGKPLGEYKRDERAKVISYLPQSRGVQDITAGRLVMHGRFPYLSYPRRYREEDRARVEEVMRYLGIWELKNRKLGELSGGQRQKVYIAKAICQDTEIVLMDEPTAFLDIRNQLETLEMAKALVARGKTVIGILHEFDSVLNYADDVVLMNEGKVTASGSPEEVLGSEALEEAFGIKPHFYRGEEGLHFYADICKAGE